MLGERLVKAFHFGADGGEDFPGLVPDSLDAGEIILIDLEQIPEGMKAGVYRRATTQPSTQSMIHFKRSKYNEQT